MSNIDIVGFHQASILRIEQNRLLRECIADIPQIKRVLNIGACPDDKDKEGSFYKDYFKNAEYYTLDKNYNIINKHHYIIDLHDICNLKDKFDFVVANNVIEHVENPFEVSKNICQVVSQNGYLFVSTPFFYPIHKDQMNRFSDYWRFTDDALRILFSKMEEVWIKESPSVIKVVDDRSTYWDDMSSTVSGYCALFRKV